MDMAVAIHKNNQGQDPEQPSMKYANMRTNPLTFPCATCHLFHLRLPVERALDEAPKIWVCGDLHLENFGSYKADNRLAYFEINDFDEAALAPCTWDLARFLTSVRLGMAEPYCSLCRQKSSSC